MSPKQKIKPDLVLSAPCNRDGEHPFVLDPPQGRNSFRIVVRCQESERQPEGITVTETTEMKMAKKCAHLPCRCDVTDGKEYCSESCRSTGKDEVEIACQCDHWQCPLVV